MGKHGNRMRTHVEFRSSKFPAYETEAEEINPGIWGRRLAEYLKQNLAARGLCTGEIFAEDWGCLLPVQDEPFRLWIGCGHQYGDDDVFLCFIEPSKPTVRKWFKKIDTTADITRVGDLLNDILSGDPEICDLKWTQVDDRPRSDT